VTSVFCFRLAAENTEKSLGAAMKARGTTDRFRLNDDRFIPVNDNCEGLNGSGNNELAYQDNGC